MHSVDLWRSATDSVTIGDIRALQHFLYLKPFASPVKAAIIAADKLTLEAQHALLKTLEEPPRNSLIILTTTNQDNLLPTITSRCRILTTPETPVSEPESSESDFKYWQSFLVSSPGARLVLTATVPKDRSEADLWLKTQILYIRKLLQQTVSGSTNRLAISPAEYVHIIRLLGKSRDEINQNCSVRLVLDQLAVTVPFSHSPSEN